MTNYYKNNYCGEKMRKCSGCGKGMKEMVGKTSEGVSYKYYRCCACGEEILDMKQLHDVANKYKNIRKYRVKLTKWGLSLGLRIPKEIIKENRLDKVKEVDIIEDKVGFKVIPVES